MDALRFTRSTLALAGVSALLTSGSAFVNISTAHAAPAPYNGTGVPNDPPTDELAQPATDPQDAASPERATAGSYFVTATALARRAPGLDGEVVAVTQTNDQVEATGVRELGYIEVRRGDETCWIHENYLSTERAADPQPAGQGLPAVTEQATATSDVLIRTSAGTTFRTVTEVPRGTRLDLTGVVQDGRTQVIYDGQVRWVSSAFLSGSAMVQPLEFLPTAILDGTPLPEVPAYADAPTPVTAEELAVKRAERDAQRAAKAAQSAEQGQDEQAPAARGNSNQGKADQSRTRNPKAADTAGANPQRPTEAPRPAKPTQPDAAATTPANKLPVAPKPTTEPAATTSKPASPRPSATSTAPTPIIITSPPKPTAPTTTAPVATSQAPKPTQAPTTTSAPKPAPTTTAPKPTQAPTTTTPPKPAPTTTVPPKPTQAPTTQAPKPTQAPTTTVPPKPTQAPTTQAPKPTQAPTTTGNLIRLPGLTKNAQNLLTQTQLRFPQIKTYYGVRQDPFPDHPSGRAIDIMIPNYKSNKALGTEIAYWAQANASSLNIDYIIWDQKIWSVARAREGWRPMANRGSDTANHKDHVHITVR